MRKYKLERKSIVGVGIENYPRTLKSLGALVACNAVGPIAYVQVHNSEFLMSTMYSDICLASTLLFFTFAAGYIGTRVYQNFKEERERIKDLINELEFEKNKKKYGFITPDELSRISIQREFDRDEKVVDFENYINQTEDNSESLGKRKSLAKAPFRNSNDYTI